MEERHLPKIFFAGEQSSDAGVFVGLRGVWPGGRGWEEQPQPEGGIFVFGMDLLPWDDAQMLSNRAFSMPGDQG